ncbi:HAD-IIIC family phosphatase [Patescibacteria group bacterium]|nr:HAD-IIIC family phosphatase [Patescibacteria group bacterium]
MEILDYLKLAQAFEKNGSEKNLENVKISIVTNFTDDLLKKTLTGLCISQGFHPYIFTVPYKQYLFDLKNESSDLYKHESEITFVFFDINPFISSEFTSSLDHIDEVLNDLKTFCKQTKGDVIIHTLINPSSVQHSRIFKGHILNRTVSEFNNKISELSDELSNVRILDTNSIVSSVGEKNIRDLRGMYAFSQPFNNEFTLNIVKEWMSLIRAKKGLIHKCIVLDLDNTLWGGVIGESGPLGVSLGNEYPGNAFLEFQKVLLDYYNHGIILAINSKNNIEDVNEMFEKNQNMILKKSHFASIVANWKTKAENLVQISNELNIGLDSIVFIDDDPMNREIVTSQLPEVMVPNWSIPPEEYAKTLLDLDAFHVIKLTDEDKQRGQMYAVERERKEILSSSTDVSEYLKKLDVEIEISLNSREQIPRLSQLTQKTNQFNLSTIRSTEKEIETLIDTGALVFSGDIKDKFGSYGITILAIIVEKEINKAELLIYLMSCRVMGRKIEEAFLRSIIETLNKKGYKKLVAKFIPTKKNLPISDFFPQLGAMQVSSSEGAKVYELAIIDYLANIANNSIPIKIKELY